MPTTMQDILRQQQQQRPLNQNSENSSDPTTQMMNGLRRYNDQSNGGLNRMFGGGTGGTTGAMGTSYAGSGAMGTGFGLGGSLVGGGMSGASAGGGLGSMLGTYGGYGGASMAGSGGFGALGGTTASAGLGSVLGGSGAAAGGGAAGAAGGGAAAGAAGGGMMSGMGGALMSNPWTAIAAAIIGGANYLDNKEISSWGDTLKGKAGGNMLDYYGGRDDGKTHGFIGKLFDQDKAPGQTTKAVTDLSEGDFGNAWKNAKEGIKSIFKLDFF